MLKRGVTRRGEFERRAIAQMRAGTGWWPVGLTLLEEVQAKCAEDDEPLLEELYARTSGGHGIHKMTRRGRMQEVDALLAEELEGRFPGVSPLVVHDMACSNGITSLDLYEVLSSRRAVVLHATDYFDALWYVTPRGSPWTVVYNADRQPLQFVGRGFAISAAYREPWKFPVNGLLRSWLMRRVLPTATAALVDAGSDPAAIARCGSASVRHVRLFHPRCLSVAEVDPAFRLGRHNVFEVSAIRSHVVRVMNALTRRHFDAERIRTGIQACVQSLREGGLLVLGRSDEDAAGEPRTTAYEWDGTRLAPLWDLYGGYEWPELVDLVEARRPLEEEVA